MKELSGNDEVIKHVLDNISTITRGNTENMLLLLGDCLTTLAYSTLDETVNMDVDIMHSERGPVMLELKYVHPKIIKPTKAH